MNWKEFKPTILFLLKFMVLYLVLNIGYGFYVSSFEPKPDPVTNLSTSHTAAVLSFLGFQSQAVDFPAKPSVAIVHNSKTVVSVYEGCNSLNVMIVFLSFVLSFGKWNRALLWFAPMGLLIIYAINIVRIGLLFLVALKLPHFLYFSHKYLFTALIYLIVLLLWIYWIRKLTLLEKNDKE